MARPIVFGTHEANTIRQATEFGADAEHMILMPDGHYGYGCPVGGVAAFRNRISAAAVGFDIACGNMAIRTNLRADAFDRRALTELATQIQREVSFGVGRKNQDDDAPVDHALFADPAWATLADIGGLELFDKLQEKARVQLGTVGSGNHYVDVFADDDGMLWVGVHFGSRGLGHTIASGFFALSQGKVWGEKVAESHALFDLNTGQGEAYWDLMTLCGRYAYAGREWVARKVVAILGGIALEEIHNHHNFAWKEHHYGEELIVVRKGATPAFPGQKGFVGGSMGDISVILEGAYNHVVDSASLIQQQMLFSTVHGAGRVMGRNDAIKGRAIRDADGELILEVVTNEKHTFKRAQRDPGSRVTREMQAAWLKEHGEVILRGGGVDESPHVYRRLPNVLADVGATVNVLHTLHPLIVVMAGDRDYDPYKD